MKPLVTQFAYLDIRRLAREGWLYPFSKCEWIWRTRGGKFKGGISLLALKEAIVLSYREGQQKIVEKVPILHSVGYRGGERSWFQCPGCKQRVALLYKASERFRCRRCYDLKYESQYPSRGRSYGRKRWGMTRREKARWE